MIEKEGSIKRINEYINNTESGGGSSDGDLSLTPVRLTKNYLSILFDLLAAFHFTTRTPVSLVTLVLTLILSLDN